MFCAGADATHVRSLAAVEFNSLGSKRGQPQNDQVCGDANSYYADGKCGCNLDESVHDHHTKTAGVRPEGGTLASCSSQVVKPAQES